MIGPITPHHHAKILALNADFVHWLSPLDAQGLRALIQASEFNRQIDAADGVLFALTHDAPIADAQHKNLAWLRVRYAEFLYIDRIIVARGTQGRGLGRRLYGAAEDFARQTGLKRMVCEVNTRPDNPGSHAFHLRSGFHAVADQDYPASDAAVRYYEKLL